MRRSAETEAASGLGIRLRLLGDLARCAGLLDDQVVAMPLDDPFELRVFVPGTEEEQPRLLPDSCVDVRLDREMVGAIGVRALAEEDRLSRRAVAFLEARDVLIHLAEERLIARGPLLPE